MRKTLLAVGFVFAGLMTSLKAQIVLNEVMPRPSGNQGLIVFNGNSGNEYIELYNNGCTAVSIAGYYIACRQDFAGITSGGAFRIPNVPAATVQPKSYVVLGTSTSSADPNSIDIKLPDYTSNYCTNSTTNFILANADGWVALYDATGTPIDGVYWSSAASNLTNAGNAGDFAGVPCVPTGSPAGVVLKSAVQIEAAFPGLMTYVGVNPSVGLTYSRIPNGGAWQAAVAPTINDLTVNPNNCNGGSCYTPVAAVTGFSYSTPVCQSAGTATPTPVAGFIPGGTYSSTSGLSINASTGVINLAASTPGSYTVTYAVVATPCSGAGSSTANITINPSVTPVTGFSYTSPVCITGTNPSPSPVAGFTTGGTYSSTAGLSINATTGVINLAASTAGSYTVTYSVAASGCNPASSSTANITITSQVPAVTGFSYSTPVCINAGTNPSPSTVAGFTTGGTYSSTTGLSINATTGVINLAASTAGSYVVTYSVAASGCNAAGSNTASITLSPAAAPVTGFSYSTPVCSNAGTNPLPTTVAGFTTGGTFTSTTGLSINSGSGAINLAASTPGSYVITYSVAASGCNTAGSSTANITINPSITPVTGFSYTSPVCKNGTDPVPSAVAGFTTGGTYSSTAGLSINPSTGIINLAASTAGTYTVTYTVAASGCNPAGNSTASITINPSVTPTTGFSYTTPVCVNAANPVPSPIAGFTTGGTYSSTSGLSINATTGVINLAASTAGSYVVTYSVASSGCNPAGSSTANIVLNPVGAPVTGFSYTTPVCISGTNPVPTGVAGFTTGGTYSSTAGLSINSSTGVINLTASTPGTYTITYTVAASSCSSLGSSTASITINPLVTPVTGFSYVTPVCATAANPVPTGVAGFTTGGTYSSTAGLSINSSTGVINLASSTPGSYTVTYAVTAFGCNAAGTNTANITINAAVTPVTGFSYTSPVCSNGTNPSPSTVAGFTTGGTFSSTSGLSINGSTGVINLASSTPGSYTVTYAVAASGCNPSGNSTANITINPSVTPITGFSYNTPVCADAANPVPVTVAGFTAGGIFSAPAGLSINPSTGVINLATSTAGFYNVTYTVAATGCNPVGSGSSGITINPVAVPVTGFSYASPVCASATNPLPVTSAGFTTGGVFSSSAGLNINASTGLIDVAASTPGNYTVTYTVASAGCNPLGSSTAGIVISPFVVPVTGFSYSSPVCKNGTNPVPSPIAGFTAGGTFSSTTGLSINASTGVINLASSTPGTYTVTYTVAASGCNPSGNSSATIVINPTLSPVTVFSYTSPVCITGTNPLPLPATGFTSGGIYTSTPGLTINSSTGEINLATSTAGVYTVTYTVTSPAACGLSGNGTAGIVIAGVPAPPSGNNPTYCEGATAGQLTATGLNLLWYTGSAGGIGSPVAPVPSTIAAGTTDFYVTQTIAGCESNRKQISVTVISKPAPPLGQTPVEYCQGASANSLQATGTGLLWYTSPVGGTASSIAPTPSTGTVGTTNYYVTQTVSGCESDPATISVEVAANPYASAGGPEIEIMEGQSVTLNGQASGNNISFLWSPINESGTLNPIVTPTNDIVYTLFVQSQDGCTSTDVVKVSVLKDMVIPNAFSPNGDNINDKWIIKNIEKYPNAGVEIYNRYGQMLFRSTGYTTPWDGTYNGSPVPVGTYFWIITPNRGTRKILKGSISVIR